MKKYICRECGFLVRHEEKFCRGCGANSASVAHEYSASAPAVTLRAVAPVTASNRVLEQIAARYSAATATPGGPPDVGSLEPKFDDFFDAAPPSRARVAPSPEMREKYTERASAPPPQVIVAEVNLRELTAESSPQQPSDSRKTLHEAISGSAGGPPASIPARGKKGRSRVDGGFSAPTPAKSARSRSRFLMLCASIVIAILVVCASGVLLKPADSPVSVFSHHVATPLTAQPPVESSSFPLRVRRDRLIVEKVDSTAEWTTLFSVLLAVCVVVGGLLVIASHKLFGTDGLLNIAEKNKYVPSQVKKQHQKVLKELGSRPQKGSIPLGIRSEWNPLQFWAPRRLCLTPARRDRNPNVLVLGSAGHGKSRLVESMIRHDIESNDRAVVVVDSDGSLVDRLVNWMASRNDGEMLERVKVIDPCAADTTSGFNPLLVEDPENLNQVASAIVSAFKCIYMESPGAQNQWTHQTANILRNALILLGLNGKSLADLQRLLSDNDFRDQCLLILEARKREPEAEILLDAWANYKKIARSEQWINWIEPILNRIQPVIADLRIRRLLCGGSNSLDLHRVLEDQQIVLVKVPRVRLEQGSAILGSLIVTGIRQAAVQIISGSRANPFPCAIYLDELSDFVDKDCFESIAADSRQLRIGITGTMRSMQSVPDDFKTVLGKSVGLLVTFALTRKDAELLGPQMFRVDGRKSKHKPISTRLNPMGTSPVFELISDEQSLNVDRLTGQEEQTFFCYLIGSIAGVFKLRSTQVEDVSLDSVDQDMVDRLYCVDSEEDDA